MSTGKLSVKEAEVLQAIVAILFLNSLVFAGLDLNQKGELHNVINSLISSFVIYFIFLIAGCVFIILKKTRWVKFTFFGILSIMTIHIFLNLFFLLTDTKIADNGLAILIDASLIWIASILVFSLWYWITDRGGPVERHIESEDTRIDLLFPQYQSHPKGWEHWKPQYLDYAFFSFFTSTSFSPSDTLPLTKRIKFIMAIEASISLVIIAMVASRAISLLS